MARPEAANLNGLVAIGTQDIDDFTDAPIAVRFTGNGIVDVRNGSTYDSDGFFEYEAGTWYNIAISADVAAQTYDVEVGRCGEQRQTVIRGASFRTDATVTDELNAWALWSSQNAILEVSVPTWLASGSCAPASCDSLGHACGQPANGCNGSLNCGDCESGGTCSRGACVPPPLPVPEPPSGGLPPSGTDDMGQLIRDNASGGIVFVPNGTYFLSDVTDFSPENPLALVAETRGGVVITRRAGAQEGETDFRLNRSENIAFVGMHFIDTTLRVTDSSNIHLWYTFHTYPPQKKPRPRHKTCGGGRAPDGIVLRNSRDLKFHGVEIDKIGNDGMKIDSVRNARVVGARFTNIDHQSYQTDTTADEASDCGHSAGDKFYHSDAIQIYPGEIHDFIVSDSYTERQMMLQVEQSNKSVSGFKVQSSWLSNPNEDCVTINTRVKSKASGATMELIIVDTTSWCEPKLEKWHFYTGGTTSGHDLLLGNVTYQTSRNAAAQTPAEDWRTAYPYEAWGCFLREDVGWTQLGATCTHSGFPSFRGSSNTPTIKVTHSY